MCLRFCYVCAYTSFGDGLLQTRELIDDLRSASEMEMQGGRSRLGADAKTLIRVLCHRSDSEASQFLKKQYKIPKSAA